MAAFQHEQADIATDLLCFCDDCVVPNTLVDSFFEPEDLSYLDDNTHHLPYLNAPETIISLPPNSYPMDEWECYQYPKRARNCGEFDSPDFIYGYSDGSVAAAATRPAPAFLPAFAFSSAELQLPMMGFSPGSSESSKKSNGGCLSAQSMAARQRRKRISEKTQELGKLIPGGNKMNTAEMFQAAFNYVKYLQAQVGILEFIGSFQVAEEGAQLAHVEELRVLASPKIQEKLYMEEKCIVPKELVETLAIDPELLSNSSISKDLDRLIRTLG
ncbi:hypothetical protein MRB53_020161 [Persea americana]|uniref:Uncharacterized protein n=1 Tax=Persea americana TaxID=3435 RepID=A0ACC2L073_PERAE|nr:hypothetical protein MRB53_020161 [Persea americana]